MPAKKTTAAILTGAEQVTEHTSKLDPSIRQVVELLRQIILSTDALIAEHIKWNNPSFYYSGEMKPFDPKEYKRDIIVMNLFKGRIMLVFPSGEKVKDATGFLEGRYKDGRRIVIFKDAADVTARNKDLQTVIKKWLQLVDQ